MSDSLSHGLVVLALGSNLGDSPALMAAAMDRLETDLQITTRRSSIWSSTPVDCPPGSPMFTNAVVSFALTPDIPSPFDLLSRLQAMESDFGRRPKVVHNEPRPLDLDLILYGTEVIESPRLVVPHPRAKQRLFVLLPLQEIQPELRFPSDERSLSALIKSLAPDPALRRMGPMTRSGDVRD